MYKGLIQFGNITITGHKPACDTRRWVRYKNKSQTRKINNNKNNQPPLTQKNDCQTKIQNTSCEYDQVMQYIHTVMVNTIRKAPGTLDQMQCSVASYLGFHCLPMFHIKDARHVWLPPPPLSLSLSLTKFNIGIFALRFSHLLYSGIK